MEENQTQRQSADAHAEGYALPELASLTEMVKMLITDNEHRQRDVAAERERMDRLREEERQRQADKNEHRIQQLLEQVAHLQDALADRPRAAPSRNTTDTVKLTRLGAQDDVEAYLTTFERIMEVNEVSRERWPFQLAPQLTGKAQQAYAALPPDDAKDYDVVKTAILRWYNINEETYRQRFRALKPKEDESPQELMTRLQDLASRWARETTTHQELLDLLLREQFLSVLPPDMKVAVMERQPKNCEEASQLAENYLQARATTMGGPEQVTDSSAIIKPTGAQRQVEQEGNSSAPTKKCPRCGNYGHWAQSCPTRNGENRLSTEAGRQQQGRQCELPEARSQQRCYRCNERGHLAYQCPQRSSLFCKQPEGDSIHAAPRMAGKNNGHPCNILLDTGTTQSLVHANYVRGEDVLDECVPIQCIHGETQDYPVAPIDVELGGVRMILKAAVSTKLPQPVVLDGMPQPSCSNYCDPRTTTWMRELELAPPMNPGLYCRRRRGECEGLVAYGHVWITRPSLITR